MLALLMLPVLDGPDYGAVVAAAAPFLALIPGTCRVLMLWPLLTPLGSFFAQPEATDVELPLASIMGFADVLAVIAAVIWLTRRHEIRHAQLRQAAPAGDEQLAHDLATRSSDLG